MYGASNGELMLSEEQGWKNIKGHTQKDAFLIPFPACRAALYDTALCFLHWKATQECTLSPVAGKDISINTTDSIFSSDLPCLLNALVFQTWQAVMQAFCYSKNLSEPKLR